jgi:hypothetical protein
MSTSAPSSASAAPSASSVPSIPFGISGSGNHKFEGKEKGRDIRYSNIVAAKSVADCVRTSLGPKGKFNDGISIKCSAVKCSVVQYTSISNNN